LNDHLVCQKIPINLLVHCRLLDFHSNPRAFAFLGLASATDGQTEYTRTTYRVLELCTVNLGDGRAAGDGFFKALKDAVRSGWRFPEFSKNKSVS
jgi:hypothetical protein